MYDIKHIVYVQAPLKKREFEKHWFGRWNRSLDPDEDHGPFTCAEQCQERSKA